VIADHQGDRYGIGLFTLVDARRSTPPPSVLRGPKIEGRRQPVYFRRSLCIACGAWCGSDRTSNRCSRQLSVDLSLQSRCPLPFWGAPGPRRPGRRYAGARRRALRTVLPSLPRRATWPDMPPTTRLRWSHRPFVRPPTTRSSAPRSSAAERARRWADTARTSADRSRVPEIDTLNRVHSRRHEARAACLA
jgi:hypothetical protein